MSITTKTIEISAFVLAISIAGGLTIASASFGAPKEADVGVVSPEFTIESSEIFKLRLKAEDQDAAALAAAGVKILNLAADEALPAAKLTEQLSEDSLVGVLKAVGFKGDALKHAWAVAMKESTGNPKAHNKNSRTGDNSYGLFQINMIGSLGPARVEKYGLSSYEDLFNPYVNARIAFEMSDGGEDWGPWGIGPNAYNGGTTGSYYKWLDEYPGGNNNG